MLKFDVVIIGAGAAGLFCAIEAGKRKRKALLIEHTKEVGKKIKISGGGRCNFTNINTSPKNYISENPYFCISALKRYTQFDFIDLVNFYKISFHEKTLGQLFCDGSSKQIINMLVNECQKYNVEIYLNNSINNITNENGYFKIFTNENVIYADNLVIATGGPSIPKMGATSWGYNIAKKFGLNIITPKPALVPFILPKNLLDKTINLAGVAANVTVSCNKQEFNEALLFTHRGLSGPAILQISSYWEQGDFIEISFLDEDFIKEEIKTKNTTIENFLNKFLSKKLAKYLSDEIAINKKTAELSKDEITLICKFITSLQIIPSDTEGYAKAEVTRGGIDTNELSSKTFACKNIANLYFIGEVVDVTGHLGGYNFQWAWSSGYSAGQYV